MTDTDPRTQAVRADHEHIYLQPTCCASQCEGEGRLWCKDPDPVDCDKGVAWTKYVRADLYDELAAENDKLANAIKQLTAPIEVGGGTEAWQAERIAELAADKSSLAHLAAALKAERDDLAARIAELESRIKQQTKKIAILEGRGNEPQAM